MGQHAEDILNGDVDEQTGEWLGGGMGFPRTLNHEPNHLFGIRNYLNRKVEKSKQIDFMKEYLKSRNINPDNLNANKMATEIQKDFAAFVKYTSTFIKNK